MATPPDLPVTPSLLFSVTTAGSQTPCHPLRCAVVFHLFNIIIQYPVFLDKHNVVFAVVQHELKISLRSR
eukprot:16263061-Heterocapsa_arctica.AAC.1